jgi:hypothetical protein
LIDVAATEKGPVIITKYFSAVLADVAIFLHVSSPLLNVSRQHDKSLNDGQWTAHNLADL